MPIGPPHDPARPPPIDSARGVVPPATPPPPDLELPPLPDPPPSPIPELGTP